MQNNVDLNEEDQKNWDTRITVVLFAYHTSAQNTVNETQFRFVYGRDARLPSDLENFTRRTNFVENISEAWIQTENQILQSAEYERKRREGQKFTSEYKVGDIVELRNVLASFEFIDLFLDQRHWGV